MAFIGGQIKEISWNHPTLGSGVLYPKSNEESTIDTGGIRSDDEANGIAGDGTAIRKMNIIRWIVETSIANNVNNNNPAPELEQLVALAADPAEAVYKFTHISGAVYSGSGFPVGDLQGSLQNATFKLKIAGSKTLVKILG